MRLRTTHFLSITEAEQFYKIGCISSNAMSVNVDFFQTASLTFVCWWVGGQEFQSKKVYR